MTWLWLSSYLLGWRGVWVRTEPERLSHTRYDVEVSGGGFKMSRLATAFDPSRPDAAAYGEWLRSRGSRGESLWERTASSRYPLAGDTVREPGRLGFAAWSGRSWLYPRDAFPVAWAWGWVAPGWSLVLSTALAPAAWLLARARRRLRHRRAPGFAVSGVRNRGDG